MNEESKLKKDKATSKRKFPSFRNRLNTSKTEAEKKEIKKTEGKKFSLMKPSKPLPSARLSPVIFKKLPEGARSVESFEIEPPYSRVNITSLPELGGGYAYYIEEVGLTEDEEEAHKKILDILSKELEPLDVGEDPKTHVSNEALRLAKKYGLTKKIADESWPKLQYYLYRDLVGFGDIEVIMNDPMIEDLSVNGVNLPVYIWHRKYESLPTNLIFTDENSLDNLIVKLTHLSSKHISTAFPILDAMLPGKDRLAATFKREVSPKGSSFNIRRFRDEPFSIIDLMELGTLNEEVAAYFWLLIENRMTIAVIGGTGAGKTSTLNALASLVRPSMKIVTVEEIPELNLPQENWVQLVSRESYGLGGMKTGEVTLFDLVKTSLRYRPDYIVVGEIRGEEAFVLFQALATGHGGLTTIHAENLDYAVKRLTSPPMNVAESYIPLINVAPLVERVQLPESKISSTTFGRRIKSLVELVNFEQYRTISEWSPLTDEFKVDFKNSEQLKKIAAKHGLTMSDILEELANRAHFLLGLKLRGIRKNVDFKKQITNYYAEAKFSRVLREPKGEAEG